MRLTSARWKPVLRSQPLILMMTYCAALFSIEHAADAAATDTVVLRDVGVYKRGPETEIPDPTLTSGLRNEMPINELVASTTRVCAHLGTVIGIRVELLPTSEHKTLDVKIDTVHQPTLNRLGRMQSVDTIDSTLFAGVPVVTGWSFEDPKTFQNGIWRFVIRDGDRVLLEQAISVSFDCLPSVS